MSYIQVPIIWNIHSSMQSKIKKHAKYTNINIKNIVILIKIFRNPLKLIINNSPPPLFFLIFYYCELIKGFIKGSIKNFNKILILEKFLKFFYFILKLKDLIENYLFKLINTFKHSL